MDAPLNHPTHRFAPIYDAIPERREPKPVHYGIRCDGPLCKNKCSFITGDRFKCAVCNDVDFCASCEHVPTNPHNRTHPVIKFKSPVRNITVSTVSDGGINGNPVVLGDRVPTSTPTEVVRTGHLVEASAVAAAEAAPEAPAKSPTEAPIEAPSPPTEVAGALEEKPSMGAVFVRDFVIDGTVVPPNQEFSQTWTLYNPGPSSWPAGCVVRWVGGDSMLNIDADQPCSRDAIIWAMESNALQSPVMAGEMADFTVSLKTPNREGTAISYWRFKLPDGTVVGDRLWCDIELRASEPEEKEVKESKVKAPDDVDVKVDGDDGNKIAATNHAGAAANNNGVGAAMIFPLLEKESPESSMHEDVKNREESLPSSSSPKADDLEEELENVTLGDAGGETAEENEDDDDDDDDDEFLTDEEYDILDASDQEFIGA